MVYCGILWYSVLEGVLVLSPTADWLCSHEETPSPKDCNPFLAAEVKEDPSLDLALQALATETSRRAASKLITTSGQPGFPRPTISSGLKPHTVLLRHYLIHRVVVILAVVCGQSGLSVTLAPFLPPVNYTLKNPRGILGRISLFKPSYKLGEDVTGTFDFSSATIACLQVSIHHHMHLRPHSCTP